MMVLLLFASLALVSGKPAAEDVSFLAEPVIDLTSGDAPAYWSAECGGRTYVGSYTLMMDWAQCRDYCTYFPHAAELGHTFSFADILDADTMECLRFNMNNQYTPGNGYAGHYWAGGYRGVDGQYRWDSGAVFDFNDFVGDPGEDAYLHLTPGNNYQWNTKNDQDDRNNGCLCKSQESSKEVKLEEPFCPLNWHSVGNKCIRFSRDNKKSWSDAHDYCIHYESELLSWRTEEEYMMTKYFWDEVESVTHKNFGTWTGAYRQVEQWGDWTWGNVTDDWVPLNYGWYPHGMYTGDDNNQNRFQCAWTHTSGLVPRECNFEILFTCAKDVQ